MLPMSHEVISGSWFQPAPPVEPAPAPAAAQAAAPVQPAQSAAPAAPAPLTTDPAEIEFLKQITIRRFYSIDGGRYQADLSIAGTTFSGILIKMNGSAADAYPPQNRWPYKEKISWRTVRKYVLREFAQLDKTTL